MPENPSRRQIANRWTPTVAELGWTPVSDYFLTNYHRLKITHIEAMLVVHLMSFKWDAAAPFPSLNRLAKCMGITPTSVRTHLRKLELKGFLYRQSRVGTTNRFFLNGLFEALERLIEADKLDPTRELGRERELAVV
jgi:DNA replication protein